MIIQFIEWIEIIRHTIQKIDIITGEDNILMDAAQIDHNVVRWW